jgi:tRNA(fMet)-specific endonuclease VapC
MTYLLDTNTCVRYINGQSERIRARLEAIQPLEIVVCSVVKAEMFFGAYKSERRDLNLANSLRFLGRFRSLPFDDSAARVYGEIRAELESWGKPIGPNDLMIAAIARLHGLTVVTHNLREFERVDGLSCEDWE